MEAGRRRLWPPAMAFADGWMLLLPALLLVSVLAVGLVFIGDMSLRTLDTSTFMLSEDWSLANYAAAIERRATWLVGWRTLWASVATTLLTLLLAFPYAYALVRTSSSAWRKFLLISLFLPFFLGQVVRAYGWLIVLGRQGLVNSMLAWFGLEPLALIYTPSAVVLGLVQYMLPFAVLMLAPALTAIPEELELASASLGAGWVRTFRHVVLPLARPGLVAAGIVVFTLSFTEYAIPQIMGGGKFDFAAQAVYEAWFSTSDAGLGSALALMVVIVSTGFTALLMALLGIRAVEGHAAPSGKGGGS
ncbi:ABC transporter permease [Geminicoccus roseus]|uniref:ABC transporter permease n=1 Tax=Geminicoccus roseus TaxID=404900 RepID=UPI0006851224